MDVRVGCSGWVYGHWRGVLYPEGLAQARWLTRYAECFDTVEVNATFYRLPTERGVARWVEQTPTGFAFAVKASRFLTHVKRLRDLRPGIDRFLACLRPLLRTPKQGPFLWQLPPDFRRDDERLARALAVLPPGEHAFEFRHESWFAEGVYELLRAHRVALAIGDAPKRAFQEHVFTAPWTFVRFHHGRRGRRGNYSDRELEEWAARVRGWPVERAWLYFNNDWEGFAVENALRLRDLLQR